LGTILGIFEKIGCFFVQITLPTTKLFCFNYSNFGKFLIRCLTRLMNLHGTNMVYLYAKSQPGAKSLRVNAEVFIFNTKVSY